LDLKFGLVRQPSEALLALVLPVSIEDRPLAMKTVGNGRKTPISTSISIFVGGNGIRFGKYGFGNIIGICGCTETNQYDQKFNGNGRKLET
jgi:hypothetical protein